MAWPSLDELAVLSDEKAIRAMVENDPQPYNEQTGLPICPGCGEDVDGAAMMNLNSGVATHEDCWTPQNSSS